MGSVDSWVGYWARLRPARAAVATNARAVTWKSLNERSGRLATGSAAATLNGIAAALGALHAGALTRFGDIEGLLGDEDRPTVLVTTCAELERPGVIERVDGAGPRLVKVPGPVPGALRRDWGTRATPFVEMLGLSLQGSPYLESDDLVPLLGVDDLAILGRRA